MVDGSRRGPYAKSAQRRQQIIDQALDVFNELGSDRTSLRSIADALGVTHPVLRHHFGTRERLFLEVLRQADARGRDKLAAENESPAGEGDRSAAGFASAIAQVVMGQPGLMPLYVTMIARALERENADSRPFFAERFRDMRREVVAILQEGQASGVVRNDIEVESAAAVIVAISDGLSTQWLIDPDVDFSEAMRMVDQLLAPPLRQGS